MRSNSGEKVKKWEAIKKASVELSENRLLRIVGGIRNPYSRKCLNEAMFAHSGR